MSSGASAAPEAKAELTAALLIIGDEILSGKTIDTNGRFLIGRLRELGVRLARIVVVPDELDDIAEQVDVLRRRYDVLITSGGIGPTHDDRTVAGIARALGRPVVREEALAAGLRHHYGERINEARLRMADVPGGTEVIRTAEYPIPVLKVENVYFLPGIPELFRGHFDAVADRFRSAPFHLATLYTTLGEGDLAAHLERCLAEVQGIAIGSYPRLVSEGWRVKVTVESRDAAAVETAVARLVDLIGLPHVSAVERGAPGQGDDA